MRIIKSFITAPKARIAIAIARCNHFVNSSLLKGAIDTLERVGLVKKENITVVWLPGAYELPLIVKTLSDTKKYDGIIAIATIIRGATKHFSYLFDICSSGISNIVMKSNIPVGFGVLITENIEQAIERSGTKSGNKGVDAALSVLEMINIIHDIKS
ncbi:6,7-dimethyl-8-ribityllumazine synthase [Arsenophonus symbiont of Ornithomya chloropus]|uniref:6,7-dimethyl-8-ribityllumazine synthase n=1 Tax=Arsenophonus symbiont of Ornithomya chloropus TaxID=634121 RepID=UPI0032B29DD6